MFVHGDRTETRKDTITYIPGVRSIEPTDLVSFFHAPEASWRLLRNAGKAFEEVRGRLRAVQHGAGARSGGHRALQQKWPFYAVGPIGPDSKKAGQRPAYGPSWIARSGSTPCRRAPCSIFRSEASPRLASGHGRDRLRSPRQQIPLHMGDSARKREQLGGHPPTSRGVHRCMQREGDGGAVVPSEASPAAPGGGRLPDALRVELDPGEHVVRGADAVLPSVCGPADEPEDGGGGPEDRDRCRKYRRGEQGGSLEEDRQPDGRRSRRCAEEGDGGSSTGGQECGDSVWFVKQEHGAVHRRSAETSVGEEARAIDALV
ncbi:unnamed protein product [Musa acuminata subsp. burmannicoides]